MRRFAFQTVAARLLWLPLLGFLQGCETAPAASESADLVLLGGRVVTMDEALPEAEAVAVRGDRIVAVGTRAEISPLIGEATEVVDLAGRLVVPGFVESHGHFLGLGNSRMILDLTTATSWEEIVAMVRDAAADTPPGTWIQGRGWHQEKWTTPPARLVDGVPLHHELSAVSPDHPVLLTHASGHAAFANARALELGGIGPTTPDPEGGTIVRDASGEPTGLLRETAQRLVGAAVSGAAEVTAGERMAELRRQVELAGEEALAHGVTSFHDAGASFEDIDGFKALADEGALPVRLYVMVRRESNAEMAEKLASYRMVGYADHFLTVRAIKRQIDGALGSHGAWLLDPYEDLSETTGLVLETVEDIEETARLALQHGYQVNTHAIGDRANREVLDIYQRTFEAAGASGDTLRWRIEHAQHLHPDDVARFKELGVVAAMQAVHGTSDGPWVPERVGEERARTGAYLWRSLLDAGVVIANGTDVPVERIDPIANFYSSVTRRMAHGEAFYPEQRMTREEALRSYTSAGAFAAFQEDVLGSITPGKLADLVVLSADILTVPEEEIRDARVDLTVLAGEVRYRRPSVVAGGG